MEPYKETKKTTPLVTDDTEILGDNNTAVTGSENVTTALSGSGNENGANSAHMSPGHYTAADNYSKFQTYNAKKTDTLKESMVSKMPVHEDNKERRGHNAPNEYGHKGNADSRRRHRKHRRRKLGVFWVILKLLILCMFLYLLWYASPINNGFGFFGSKAEKRSTPLTTSAEQDAISSGFTVIVQEDKYYVNESEVSLDDIKSLLSELNENAVVTVKDQSSIKQTYENIINLLIEQNVTYQEV